MLKTLTHPKTNDAVMIEYNLTIRAPINEVFKALSNNLIIDEWGGGPSRVKAKIHGDISFWDEEMFGTIREIEAPSLLIYTLLHRSWGDNVVDSLVTWKMKEIDLYLYKCCIKIVPNRKLKSQDELWAASFLGPLKAYLEKIQNLQSFYSTLSGACSCIRKALPSFLIKKFLIAPAKPIFS